MARWQLCSAPLAPLGSTRSARLQQVYRSTDPTKKSSKSRLGLDTGIGSWLLPGLLPTSGDCLNRDIEIARAKLFRYACYGEIPSPRSS